MPAYRQPTIRERRAAWNHAAVYLATRVFIAVGLGLMALEAIYLLARI